MLYSQGIDIMSATLLLDLVTLKILFIKKRMHSWTVGIEVCKTIFL